MRAACAQVAILAALVGLTLLLLPAPASPCDALDAVAANPLDIAVGAATLERYGRSSSVLAPGETLCVALVWQGQDDGQIGVLLAGDEGTIARVDVPVGTPTVALRVPQAAPAGSVLLRLVHPDGSLTSLGRIVIDE
ncbi:MAG: hypothetical protein GYB64_06565 [Chloroflexi bacterium]|nr:hypothetical protein [Chloroflexota bacterium]